MGSGDYCKILFTTIKEQIKKSYKNLSRKVHREKRISEAVDVPNKRRIYDLCDLYGKYKVNFENGDGNNMEGDGGVGVVEIDLICTLEELYSGCRKKVNFVWTFLDDSGELKSEEGILKIAIPPGLKKDKKITFSGEENELPGSPPLYLTFVLNEKPHHLFQRDGHDLVMIQKISFLEALVGTTLNITTLDGRNITVEVTDIVTPGCEKVVSGEGMPLARDSSQRGNLRIIFDVVFPSNLTSQQKHEVRMILCDAVYDD